MPVRACSLDEEGLLRIIRNTLKETRTYILLGKYDF